MLEVTSWSCFYFSTAPPRKKEKPVNSAWSFVHSRVLNLFIVKWTKMREEKKTADSRQWFKWQKAKAIQLTIYINEIPDLPKVLEQLAKHRRKAPALFNSNPLKMQLQSCNWQSLQSWAGHPPKIHPQKKTTQIHQIPNANNNHLRKFRFLVSKRRHKHATFSEASWIKAILWSCFKLGVTGTNNNRGFNIGVS